ncbi:hypothetical protein QUB47_09515 [Microcoleus sp. AT9_B5]
MKIFSAIEHPQVKINLNSKKKETAVAANSFGDAANQKVDRRLLMSQDLYYVQSITPNTVGAGSQKISANN